MVMYHREELFDPTEVIKKRIIGVSIPKIGDKVVVVDAWYEDKRLGIQNGHTAKVVKIIYHPNDLKIILCHNPQWDLYDGIRSMGVSQIRKIGEG